MPNFAIVLRDRDESVWTRDFFINHTLYLHNLQRDGKLIFNHSFVVGPEAFIIVDTKDEQEAHTIAQEDPLVKGKYYRDYKVCVFQEDTEQ